MSKSNKKAEKAAEKLVTALFDLWGMVTTDDTDAPAKRAEDAIPFTGTSHPAVDVDETQFALLESGRKSFDARYNDGDYAVGDTVMYGEIDANGDPTGREAKFGINYVMRADEVYPGATSYVVFSLVAI